jgi:hypothetical protein
MTIDLETLEVVKPSTQAAAASEVEAPPSEFPGLVTAENGSLVPNAPPYTNAQVLEEETKRAEPAISNHHKKELQFSQRSSGDYEIHSSSSVSPAEMEGSWSAERVIRFAKKYPPKPIVQGLLNEGETLLIHGTEESFKSFFVIELAKCISIGCPFLRAWPIPTPRRVGILETEMHPAGLGERLAKIFADVAVPGEMLFFDPNLLDAWRGMSLKGKFEALGNWVETARIQVLMVDTANDFFRGSDNPSDERVVGEFFDGMRNLPESLVARILVRHDRKKKEHDGGAHSNELIRGSARWKEDPEAIVYLKRVHKRTHEVYLEVGKLRYGAKPEPLQLWFDADRFRLVPLPPVIAALESGVGTREEIVTYCSRCFGVGTRTVDEMLHAESAYLNEGRERHKRTFEVDMERAKEAPAPWSPFFTPGPVGEPVSVQEPTPSAQSHTPVSA